MRVWLHSLLLVALLGVPTMAPSGAEVTVIKCLELSAEEGDLAAAPVSVMLDDYAGSVAVKDAERGVVVPSQTELVGNRQMVTWIARSLEKGETVRYAIIPAHGSLGRDPRGVRLKQRDGAVDVNINGRLFTRYVYSGAPKPYCYPIVGPTGKPVTRSYPMAELEGEKRDHPHHRSLWFTHGSVNGTDFWSESSGAGRIVHREFETLLSGPIYGKTVARNDWFTREGAKVCEDRRELRIYRISNGRLLDFEITIFASEGPLMFGDTKEGMFGVRVASSMDVDAGKGRIVNSRGEIDGNAWGKQAEWCDYCGPVDGEAVGIAVMDHPDSFRHPTYWHVRTYGLFAANPFGIRDFTGDKAQDGGHTIPAGGEIVFKYRIFIHEGSMEDACIEDAYRAFAEHSLLR